MSDHHASGWQGYIFVVDDSQPDLYLVAAILTEHGYNVRSYQNGASALAAARDDPPILILLAVDMPGMDGYAVCRQLKADERSADVSVIFMYASHEVSDPAQVVSAGGADYVTKPFRVEDLLVRVETQVKLHNMQQQIEIQSTLLEQAISQDKQAETELQRHREQIEELVEVRIAEIRAANQKLQRDVGEYRQAEDALRRTRFTVENMSDALYWVDPNARIVDVNETACRMLGYSREEFFHMSVLDLDAAPPFDVQPGFAERLRQTGVATFETQHRAKDGRLIPVEIVTNMIRFNDQEFNCCFVRDITPRTQVAVALQESEERYRSLVETAEDPIFTSDVDGRYLFANGAAAVMFGLTPIDMVGKTAHDLFPAHVADGYLAAIRQVFHTGTGMTVEAASEINGQLYWFSTKMHPIRDQQGDITTVQAVVRDITNLKRTDEALRESEGRLRRAELLAHMGHYAFDADLANLVISDGLKEIWGFERDASPDVAQLLARLHPDDQWALAEMNKAAEEMRGFDVEYRIIHPDGSERIVHSTAEIVPNEPGRLPRFFGTMVDITERKQSKALLQQSQEQLRTQYRSFPIPTYTYQRQGQEFVLVDYNDAAAIATQGGVANVVGRSLRESITNRPDLMSNIKRCFQERRNFRDEVSYKIQPTGQASYFISTYVFAPPDLVMIHTEDITEQRQAEEKLRISEERLQQAMRVSGIGIFDHDHLSDTIYWSPEQRKIHGWGPEKPITLSQFLGLVHPADTERIAAAVRHAHNPAGDGLYDVEHRIVRPDGCVRWLVTRSQTFFDGEGEATRPLRTVGAVLDVTESKEIEEALQVKDNAIASAITAIVIAGTDGVVTYVNPSFLRLWGFDNEQEVLGKSAQALWTHPPEEVPQVMESMKETGSWIGEVTAFKKDGAGFEAQLSASLSKDRFGEPTHLMGSLMDISERKRAEKALSESVQQNRALIEAVPDMLFRINREGVFLDYRAPQGSALYAAPETFLGHTVREIMPPQVAEPVMKSIARSLHDQELNLFEYPLTLGDEEQFFEGRAVPLSDSETLVVVRDITERKRTEQMFNALNAAALAMQRASIPNDILSAVSGELAKIGIQCAIFATTEDKQKVTIKHLSYRPHALRTVEKLTGFNLSQITIPINSMDVFRRPMREKQTVLVEEIQEAARQYLPGPLKRLAGSIVQILQIPKSINAPMMVEDEVIGLFSVQSINLGQSDVPAITAFANQLAAAWRQAQLFEQAQHELTARRQAEEEIRHLNAELEQRVETRTRQLQEANKELEAFSYSVSHDLRAPLRAIDGYTRILLEDYESLLDAEGKRVCGVIRDNTRQMGRLIDDLLTFSRLSRASMQSAAIDMSALVTSTFLELVPHAERQRIDFQREAMSPAVGDLTMMRQVWVNLLSNAVKFSSKRECAIIRVESRPANGETIYSISDNGAGFDMRYVDKLFGVFQRLHSEREFEGTGVGLAIIQQVVHRHGGRVWAESQIDQGATFYFALPRKGNE